ncbi:hypothetical protein ACOMHN_016553 [Nucella lapillus]
MQTLCPSLLALDRRQKNSRRSLSDSASALSSLLMSFGFLHPRASAPPPTSPRGPWGSSQTKPGAKQVGGGYSWTVGSSPLQQCYYTTSLKRSAGRPVGRCPVASSPYMKSFGMRRSFIRCTCTCPNQRRQR